MSDFLAEARIVVRPDTSLFAAELAAQLKAVTSAPIPIRVVPIVAPGTGAAAAAASGLAASQEAALASTLPLVTAIESLVVALEQQTAVMTAAIVDTEAMTAAQLQGAAAVRDNAAASLLSTSNLKDARRGIIATALSFVGLRGATLAASGGFIAAAAGALAFTKSIALAAGFERSLNVFRVTAGATADEMRRVSETARQLGRDITLPGVSAGDAAQTLTELSKAGLSVRDSLDAARGTLQLATAAQIDNATATELVANALNAFGLAGTEATRVADLLAGAANESQGSIADMGIALRQVAPVAALVNFSVEDTVTILTQLARSGLSASDAGTSFRQALLRLVQNMPKVNAEVARLGLNLRDAAGFIRPEVFGELEQKLNELTPAAREAAIATLGGADAIRTFGILAREGADAFQTTKTAVTEAGLAQKLAAAQTAGFSGDVENLKNAVGDLALGLGEGLVPSLTKAVEGLTLFAQAIRDAKSETQGLRDQLKAGIPGKGFFDNLFGGSIFDQIRDLEARLRHLQEVGSDPVGFAAAVDRAQLIDIRQKVDDIIASFQKLGGRGGGDANLIATVGQLQALADKLALGDAASKKLAEGVRGVAEQLGDPKLIRGFIIPPIKIPPSLATDAVKDVQDAFDAALPGADLFEPGAKLAQSFIDGILSVLPNMLAAAQAVVDGAAKAAISAGRLAVGRIDSQLTDVEFQGGSEQQQRAVLVKKLAAQENVVAQLEKDHRKRSAIDAAKQAAIATRNRIEAIDAASASAAESAAAKSLSDAKARAQALQKAKDDADQAILDTFSLSRSQAQNRIAAAALTPGLADDIRRQKEFRALVQTEIKVIIARIKDEGVRKAAVAALRAIVTATTAEIAKLVQAQKDSAAESAAAARQGATDVLGKRLQLAELRGNKDAILNALNAAIADARKRIKAAKTVAERLDEQIALQELINKKNEILAETTQKGNDAAKFFFEQLQAQQGFAANLLGNLIPSGQTAGLVGVPSPAAKPPTDVGAGLGAAAGVAQGVTRTSPTAGQASTTNQILRSILHVLTALNRGAESPEAIYQAKVGRSAMDGGGGNLESGL